MLYRKAQVSDRWLRAPLQAPTALHQPLSYISRSHIADVFASQENGRKTFPSASRGIGRFRRRSFLR